MVNFWRKLKDRYNIKSDLHAVFVLFIFAIAGSSILFVKKPLFEFLRYDEIPNAFLKVLAYIAIILPTYYVLLFLWSNLLGQGKIFNPLIIKMISGWGRLFKKRKK